MLFEFLTISQNLFISDMLAYGLDRANEILKHNKDLNKIMIIQLIH
ncbi:putative uncharacterized protein [Parachlamydia acanthamoebae UV-7]|uniref:Uncharacterized protein n=2 Tax=Parachlamydia acanthamoebae TaxID=83552 RepID=F8KVB7_PARAV|nr:hypothetical protein pah_c013o018 [Parachlamydia acanthamoebae str. Hall's coccus]KIA76682.1 hypothetical protein DB43_HM00050 [Parachlamydia acanthamoebae]CCB87639.1 putative uncharacterized protein [Parachlamydia acanthamoebae UV-7]